ncbi:MAG: hypothetical protein SGARI_000820 [Bacillariaceae sp.]
MTPRTTTSLLATLLAACLVLAPASNADSDSAITTTAAIDQEHRSLLKEKKQLVQRQTDCDQLKTEEDEEAGLRQLSFVRAPGSVGQAFGFSEAMEKGGSYGVADVGADIEASVYAKQGGGIGGKKGGKKGGYDSSMSMVGKKGGLGFGGKKGGYDSSMSMLGKKGGYGGKKGGYDSSMSLLGKKGVDGGKKGGYDSSMSMLGKKGGDGGKKGGKKGGYGSMSLQDTTDNSVLSPTEPVSWFVAEVKSWCLSTVCAVSCMSLSHSDFCLYFCSYSSLQPVDCTEPAEPEGCPPDWDAGDNPCLPGCGHGMIANPFNPNSVEAEKEPRPAACRNYSCVCADSGCGKSWDEGCIKWYMQCQSETQVCGSMDSAPTAVQEFNIGSSCNIAPTSANSDVCFNKPLTPAPTDAAQVFPPPVSAFSPSSSMSMHGKKGRPGGKKGGYDSSMSMLGKKGGAGGKKGGAAGAGGKKGGYGSMSMLGKKGGAGGKKGGQGRLPGSLSRPGGSVQVSEPVEPDAIPEPVPAPEDEVVSEPAPVAATRAPRP